MQCIEFPISHINFKHISSAKCIVIGKKKMKKKLHFKNDDTCESVYIHTKKIANEQETK